MGSQLEKKIKESLELEYSPQQLEIENVSYLHTGHESIAGNTSKETHFKILIVTNKFNNVSLLQRHKMVYKTIDFAMKMGLHAVELKCIAPSEIN